MKLGLVFIGERLSSSSGVGRSWEPIKVKNSAREAVSLRSWPCNAEVTVLAPDGSYATYGHAQMLGFHDDTQTARRNLILEPVGDLLRQPFLHLRAAGEQLDDPGQLGQAKNPLPW